MRHLGAPLLVKDTGIGVPLREASLIFQAFDTGG